jgi:SAM-dependent methyltransferase
MYPPFADPVADAASQSAASNEIDPFVQQNLIRTNGKLYWSLRGKLTRYPIPELPLPVGEGRSFLDIGSNWGRWTIAAARKGYRAIGMDVSLSGARAGRRVARQLGVEAGFIVADARRIPFLNRTFDVCFSFSVLQHFEKRLARQAVEEMARVTNVGGRTLVQMANRFGLLQLVNQARQALRRDHSPFRVHYWTTRELRTLFNDAVGPSQIYPAGFFSLDAQGADLDLLAWREAALVRVSETLRRVSQKFPPLTAMADSLYVDSLKKNIAHDRNVSLPERD